MSARHVHAWQPLSGWSGRYRCPECHAIGYRGIVNLGANTEALAHGNTAYGSAIVPYRCTWKGCTRAAVARKPQRCAEHRP